MTEPPGERPHQLISGGYPQPLYPYWGVTPPPPGPQNDLGTVSLVLGVVAVVLCWLPFAGLILGMGALVIGIVAWRRAKRGQATNKGVAIGGIVLSMVATIIGGLVVALLLVPIINYQNCIDNAPDRPAYARC